MNKNLQNKLGYLEITIISKFKGHFDWLLGAIKETAWRNIFPKLVWSTLKGLQLVQYAVSVALKY